jgi:hypothetical protein
VSHELQEHLKLVAGLRAELEQRFETSVLPDEPARVDALDDFLIRLRTSAAS